jgi:hypothetical protein
MRKAVLALGAVALAATALAVPPAPAEVAQQGNLRVAFEGKLSPHELPRSGAAPISVSFGGRISTTDGLAPPQLREIEVALNRHGRLDRHGLPVCHLKRLQPSSNKDALKACRSSLVGEGFFTANVLIPGQAPFPSRGRVLAFNGTLGRAPVIFAHVYGTEPVPTSYTLPFAIRRDGGTFATVLSASLPDVTSDVGFVTGLRLELERRFRHRGKTHSYLGAGCPAPKGFPGAVFPFARASFSFAGGSTLSSTLTRSCRAGG